MSRQDRSVKKIGPNQAIGNNQVKINLIKFLKPTPKQRMMNMK